MGSNNGEAEHPFYWDADRESDHSLAHAYEQQPERFPYRPRPYGRGDRGRGRGRGRGGGWRNNGDVEHPVQTPHDSDHSLAHTYEQQPERFDYRVDGQGRGGGYRGRGRGRGRRGGWGNNGDVEHPVQTLHDSDHSLAHVYEQQPERFDYRVNGQGRGGGYRGRGRGRGRGDGRGRMSGGERNRPIAVLDPFDDSQDDTNTPNANEVGERSFNSFGHFGSPIEAGDPFASDSRVEGAGHTRPTRPEPVFTPFGNEDFVGRSIISSPSSNVRKRLDEEAEELQREIKKLEEAKRKKQLRDIALATKKPSSQPKGIVSRKRNRVDLKNAVSIVGICPTMCPKQEMEDREIQRSLSIFERYPGEGYNVDPERAVKKYRRSAALAEEPSPEEIRPSPVLAKTMDYLKNLCDTTSEPYHVLHSFVRDRTRSIRQDFTFQGIRDGTYVRILEECVRFHIMSEHKLYGSSPEVFSSKQNLEQLDKCLITLRQIYDENRKLKRSSSDNEGEMQAYYLLLHAFHPKTRVQVYSDLPHNVLMSAEVQLAHRVSDAVSSSFVNFVGFFSMVKEAPYLVACMLHRMFGRIRSHAAMVIAKAFSIPNKVTKIPVHELMEWLGFDSEDELEEFCSIFGWDITEKREGSGISAKTVRIHKKETFSYPSWAKGNRIIESKCQGLKLSQIISGTNKFVPSPEIFSEVRDVPDVAAEPFGAVGLASSQPNVAVSAESGQDRGGPTTPPTIFAIGTSGSPGITQDECKDSGDGSSTKRKRASPLTSSSAVTQGKDVHGSSKRPRTFTSPCIDNGGPISLSGDTVPLKEKFIASKDQGPDFEGTEKSGLGSSPFIFPPPQKTLDVTPEPCDTVEAEPEEDAELKKEREDDKVAFDQLVLFENEFKEIACTPNRTLDFVEVEMKSLSSWKQDPPRAHSKVVHLCSIVETMATGLKHLKRKAGDVKPVFADTEEKQDWILADCIDDLEFANKLWHKLRMIRRAISIRLLRAGISIRST